MADIKTLPESTRLKITYRKIGELIPYTGNARTHSDKQIAQIAASIRKFGFTNPVLIDEEGGIVAGHGRVAAAKQLGIAEVPTIVLGHLTPTERRAYVIADNRLAELAGWDREILKIEFQALAELDLDFDLEITGFETAELDLLLDDSAGEDAADPADEMPEPVPGPAVTQPGDVWLLGKHRLICGDARDPATYAALMGADRARAVFTDPPYNVKIDGHVSGLGAAKHREFAFASGEMTEDEFTRFLARVFVNLANAAADGAIHFVCMDWRHQGEVLAAARGTYSELKNLCVWAKTNGGMGSLYRSQHELVFVFKSGRAPHINNVELGKHGRYRTNVWSYAGANAFSATRDDDLAMHPTVKPVALVADAILDCSKRKGLVLDAFGGSGTTLVAAERTGRRGAAIEIDPHYCDVIVRRLAKACNLAATLVATGLSFDEVAKLRRSEAQAEEAA